MLGARQRSVQAAGVFDHATGEGFVARHDGDYHDAINHRKANVKLVLHGALGGMSVFTSKILHRAARDAKRRRWREHNELGPLKTEVARLRDELAAFTGGSAAFKDGAVATDAAGNPLPPFSAACACSDATKARLNAAPASLREAKDPL